MNPTTKNGKKIRAWTDVNIEAILEIYQDNREYEFVNPTLNLAGHISNLLLNLYSINLTNTSVLGLVRKLFKKYNRLARAWLIGQLLEKNWPYFDLVNQIIQNRQTIEQNLAELDKNRLLTPEDTWTVGELECLINIYERTNTFNFEKPNLGLCEKISQILQKQNGIKKTGHQVQVKVKRLNKEVNRFAKSKESYSTFPFFQRIKRLPNRL